MSCKTFEIDFIKSIVTWQLLCVLKLREKTTRPITHRVNIVLVLNGKISTPEISNRSWRLIMHVFKSVEILKLPKNLKIFEDDIKLITLQINISRSDFLFNYGINECNNTILVDLCALRLVNKRTGKSMLYLNRWQFLTFY